MPETPQILFSYQEIAEALVKQQGIHEGLWGLHAAIVPVQGISLRRFDEEVGGLTVDAAAANPAP